MDHNDHFIRLPAKFRLLILSLQFVPPPSNYCLNYKWLLRRFSFVVCFKLCYLHFALHCWFSVAEQPPQVCLWWHAQRLCLQSCILNIAEEVSHFCLFLCMSTFIYPYFILNIYVHISDCSELKNEEKLVFCLFVYLFEEITFLSRQENRCWGFLWM